jgi:hypothetical protein
MGCLVLDRRRIFSAKATAESAKNRAFDFKEQAKNDKKYNP